jgi:hypothetical protein
MPVPLMAETNPATIVMMSRSHDMEEASVSGVDRFFYGYDNRIFRKSMGSVANVGYQRSYGKSTP